MGAWRAKARYLDVTLVEGASDYEDDIVDHVPVRAVVQELPQVTVSL